MDTRETPFTFTCQGANLVGMLHEPQQRSPRGVLFLVPYAPQSRIGVCRNLVLSARSLAEQGITCMRFDQRGIGDSGGEPAGFRNMGEDIAAACRAFMAQAPWIDEIIIWGECNAAAGALIAAWRQDSVKGLILQNPRLSTEQLRAKAVLKQRYLRRLREKSFWLKVFSLEFSPLGSLRSMLELRRQAQGGKGPSQPARDDADPPFQELMIAGALKFKGPVLFILTKRAIAHRVLDELAAMYRDWRVFLSDPRTERVLIDGAHSFDSQAFRDQMVRHAIEWIGRK